MKIVPLLFFLYAAVSLGQNPSYTIFSFEYDVRSVKKTHYWIIENDSIENYSELNLKPLIINIEYSVTQLNSCCSGGRLDSIEENYGLSEFPDFSNSELVKYLKKNRKFLQKVTHKYATGVKTSLKIYATPIVGDLCLCMVMNQQPLGIVIEYVSTYLPKSFFTIEKSFNKTDKWKRLRYYDFSDYLHESFH